MTRGGSQGNPFGGYRPGRSIEHEPVDRSERMPMDTAQNVAAHDDDEEDDRQQPVVFSHAQAGRDIRAALRGT